MFIVDSKSSTCVKSYAYNQVYELITVAFSLLVDSDA